MSDSSKPLAVFEKDGKKREAYTPADVVKYRFDGWREKDAPAKKSAPAKSTAAKTAPAKKPGTKKATAPKAATQPPAGDTISNSD